MTLATHPFDVTQLFDSEQGIAEFLRLVCEDGSPAEIAKALGDVSRARGMSEIAKKTGLARPALYRALSGEGKPELATIAKVAQALGFQLTLTPRLAPAAKPAVRRAKPKAPAKSADAA